MQEYADFHGDRDVTAPLTWGQYAIWKAIVALAPGDNVLNIGRVLAVPRRADADVAAVAKAIGTLIGRHESLRTRIRDVGGEPHQEVVREGRLPLRIVDSSLDHAAQAANVLASELARPRFDYAQGWPLRVGLVVVDGRVAHVALAASHAAMDAHAAEIVLRELRLLLLRGTVQGPLPLQPADLAERESGGGAEVTDRAIAYWLQRYSGLPAAMFEPVGPPETPRFRKASLISPAAEAAARLHAARHGISTSTVLLAATAGLIAAWTGQRTCGLLTIAGNRLQPGHETLVAPTNQLGLVVIEVGSRDTLADLLPRAWKEALRGYRHAYCDPVALNHALESTGRAHGAQTQPYCLFNDVRQAGAERIPTASELAALLAGCDSSTLSWPESFDRFNWSFFLEVQAGPGALDLRLAADTGCLPTEHIERFLRMMERLLVDAAQQEVPLAHYAT